MSQSFATTLGRAAAQAIRHRVSTPPATLPTRVIREEVRPDPGRAVAFAHLVGDVAGTALHPGYVHTLGFPLTMRLLTEKDFPLPLLGMVHISNTVTTTGPIRLDDTLEIAASIDGVRPHYAGTLLDSMLRVSVAGREVLTDHSEYLVRGSEFAGERPPKPERDAFVPPAQTAAWRLGADAGRTFATVSGDRNPIHLTRLSAKLFGFNRPIIHGMYSASRAFSATGVSPEVPLTWFVGFDAPITLPSTVAFGIERDGETVNYVGWRPARAEREVRRHFHGYVRSEK